MFFCLIIRWGTTWILFVGCRKTSESGPCCLLSPLSSPLTGMEQQHPLVHTVTKARRFLFYFLISAVVIQYFSSFSLSLSLSVNLLSTIGWRIPVSHVNKSSSGASSPVSSTTQAAVSSTGSSVVFYLFTVSLPLPRMERQGNLKKKRGWKPWKKTEKHVHISDGERRGGGGETSVRGEVSKRHLRGAKRAEWRRSLVGRLRRVSVFKEWKKGRQWEPGRTNGPRDTAARSVSRLPSVKSNTAQQCSVSDWDFQNKATSWQWSPACDGGESSPILCHPFDIHNVGYIYSIYTIHKYIYTQL